MSNKPQKEKINILPKKSVYKNLHINIHTPKKVEETETSLNSIKTTADSTEIITSNNQILNMNYSFISEYFDEIYQNMLLDEIKFYQKINSDYLSNQPKINIKMRAILVDWIIDIHNHYNFEQKTLFNTIYIIDAYLSKNIIETKNFQLLGLSSLLISCKENEIKYPNLNIFVRMADNAYNAKQIINMEKKIMKCLDFGFLGPTCDEFFDINAEYFNFTEKQKFFGKYFLDSSLIDYNFIQYKPSTIGIACCYIVMKFFKLDDINSILNNTNYDIKDIKNCSYEVWLLVENLSNSTLKATKNKYLSDKFLKVAELY